MHKDWSEYAAVIGIGPATFVSHPLRPWAGWLEGALGLLVLVQPTRLASGMQEQLFAS
jgi:hypothetical protein